MVTVKANDARLFLNDFDFGDVRDSEVYISKSNHYEIEWNAGEFYDFYGSGLQYDGSGIPTAGVITSFQRSSGGAAINNREMMTSFEGVHIDAKTFMRIAHTVPTKDDSSLMISVLSGDDKVLGGNDPDQISGYAGDDVLQGRNGEDVIDGDTGNDKIDGGKGDDFLRGSKGADTFIFSTGYGHDTIRDFHASGADHDVLDLSRFKSIKNFDDLMKHHVIANHDGLQIGDSEAWLTLQHVTKHDIGKEDFLFG